MEESEPLSSLRLSSLSCEGTTTVLVSGELDIATTGQVRAYVERALGESGTTRVILDMRGITFIAAAGIGLLAELRNTAALCGTELLLGDLSPVVIRLLALVGLAGQYPLATVTS
ncbi:MAG TPA: STAS domain-containing protein [Streptosporangiaceae bacterium]|jgi:anti-sigma B factor antagonist|nr:STAS domain-containing protein [Streptosporangiaceae bacterium]